MKRATSTMNSLPSCTVVKACLVIVLVLGFGVTSTFGFTLFGTKWGHSEFGTGASVTWSLAPTGTSCVVEFVGCTLTALEDFMPAGFKTEVVKAFNAWEAVADLNFTEVLDDGTPFNSAIGSFGEIRLGGHMFDGISGILAHGFFPPPNGLSAAGDIHFDIAENWVVDGLDGNLATKDIFQITTHEIGHAIGLRHEFGTTALMNAFYSEQVSGLQPDDIAGAQALYGQPIPEPGTWLLFFSGLVGLAAWRRAQSSFKKPVSH